MFVTFEGGEGSGKSTQIKLFQEKLFKEKILSLSTREPGSTEIGKKIREVLLTPGNVIPGDAELLLYLADRVINYEKIIKPALGNHFVVLCDRYIDSTIAYQGGGRRHGQLKVEALHALLNLSIKPDLTFLFDVDPLVGLVRSRSRLKSEGMINKESRFEDEAIEFHSRVRETYLALSEAEPERFHVIDTTYHEIQDVAYRVYLHFKKSNLI